MFLGYSWINVFHQDAKAGGMFPSGNGANRKQVLKWNEEDPMADRRSILYRMEDYRGKDGLFHIRLCYPEYSEPFPCNEWTQSSNFVEDTEIANFTALELTYTSNYGTPFPGLKAMTGWTKNYFWSSASYWDYGVGYGYSGGTQFEGASGKTWVSMLDIYIAGGINLFFKSQMHEQFQISLAQTELRYWTASTWKS